jgi:1-deoxy-D-xylulose-5-phosphate synthase
MRCVPNLKIAAPRNEIELRNLLYTAQLQPNGPIVIRYPRGKGFIVDWRQPMTELEIGKGECLKMGNDIAVLTIGSMANAAANAIKMLEKEHQVSIAHYDIRFLKPLDEVMLHEVARKFKNIVTIEDGTVNGGFGSAVLEFMSDNGYTPKVKRLGVKDEFVVIPAGYNFIPIISFLISSKNS